MFTGKIVGERFLLLHGNECIGSMSTQELEAFAHPLESLAYPLLVYYFLDHAGQALAEVKASELSECVSCYLPKQLEFAFDDSQLADAVELAVRTRATELFEDYCGQQLYIQTLQTILSDFQARDGP
jgi:hypothetical protein